MEGYPALVVHGPLSQCYLMNFARDCMAPKRMTSFDMRARAPLFIDGPVRLVGKPTEDGCEVWAVTPEGDHCDERLGGFRLRPPDRAGRTWDSIEAGHDATTRNPPSRRHARP